LSASGGGAVTAVLFHNPKALIHRPPYLPWLFVVAALAAFALTLALGLEDGWADDDEVNHAERWRTHRVPSQFPLAIALSNAESMTM
jgi:hypothetical protein